jgi:alcohol dehydrogenase class IV
VRETDVETLAATTLGDACLSTNPRDADATDIAALFRATL